MSPQGSTTSMNSLFDTTETRTPISVALSPDTSINHLNDIHSKNIIILVGLPATGKSTISDLLMNYLNHYTRYKTKIFNCGKVRRQTLNSNDLKPFHDYQCFDPNNQLFKFKREFIAMQSLNNIIDELNDNNINVGILDATNTTLERRSNLVKFIKEKTINDEFKLNNLIILDVKCNNLQMIKYNIHAKTKNDDYRNYDIQKAIDDFTKRLDNYEKAYEPITDDELIQYQGVLSSYMLMENGGIDYRFNNYIKSDLVNIINDYIISYSNYEAKIYHEKVQLGL